MRETEFREWLEANGANSVSGRNTRVYAVKTIESNLQALGFSQPDLEAVWAEKQFEKLREVLAEIKADAAADGERYRILMPQAEAPVSRLSSWRSWLGQYGRFLEGGGIDMTDAGLIRRHVLETYIEPARTSDQSYAELVVKDVNDALGLNQAWPNICQAMKGRKFLDLADVPPPQWFGADHSTATRFRFDVDRGEYWALTELIRRYAAPIAETKKMASFQMKDGRQVALDLEATRAQLWLEGTIEPLTAGAVELQPYAANAPRHSNLPPRLKPSGSDPQPVTLAIVRNSEDLQLLLDLYEARSASLDRQNLDRLKARFLSQFPDFESGGGFTGRSSYHPEEDDYKRTLVAQAQPLRGNVARSTHIGGQILDILLNRQSNLLGYFKTNIRLKEIRERHPGDLERAVGDLANSDLPPPSAAEQFLEAAWPLLVEGTETNKPYGESRILSTVVQALTRPTAAISVIYQRFHNLGAALLGRPLFGNNPLTAQEYQDILDLSEQLFIIMRDEWGWAPRDLWDVQGFIWATCGSKLEGHSEEMDATPIWIVTARYGDDDGLPRFIERGEFSLVSDTGSASNKRMAEMRLGDHIFLRDYFHQTSDLPFDANGGRVSAIRIRAKGKITHESEDRLRIGVEWEEPMEPRVWYFYTFTDPVWGLKAPGESVSADMLRRFLLLGEDQDYQRFLNDPFWRDRLFRKPKEAITVTKPTNLILYGPPGTGKTYRTASEAVRLCDGHADYATDAEGRADLMQRHGELQDEGRIRFVTFHQNFSYEEFVEGLRPETNGADEEDSGSSGFRLEPQPGIFRELSTVAEDARRRPAKPGGQYDIEGRKFWKMALGRIGSEDSVFEKAIEGDYVALGWGGEIDWSDNRYASADAIREEWKAQADIDDSPSHYTQLTPFRNTMKIGDIVIVPYGNKAFRAIGEVTGDYYFEKEGEPTFYHRRKVNWLAVPDEPQALETIVDGNFQMRSFYSIASSRINKKAISRLIGGTDEAAPQPTDGRIQQFVLIIDEINRANISKVFGELITLLEPDKRLGQRNALTVRLPYSKKEFGVPSNLHMIGTMITADRSIALLDTALRRRFRFEEIAPEPWRLGTVGNIPLPKVLTVINERIEYLIDRDHRIGHAFFMGDGGKDRAAIDSTMRDKVIPLLQEYFFEDWSRIVSVVGDGFLEKTVLAPPPGITGERRESWSVRSTFLSDAYDRLLKGSIPDDGSEQPDIDDEYDEA